MGNEWWSVAFIDKDNTCVHGCVCHRNADIVDSSGRVA